MHTRARACVAFIALFLAGAAASAQTTDRDTKGEKEATASITGRVTVAGKAAAGITVTLAIAEPSFNRAPSVKTTADEDGRYRLTAIAAGRYTVSPFAPALVVPQDLNSWLPGKPVTVSEGEQIEGLNFELTRGGVITGRVVDDKGRPVIEQYIHLLQVDERGQKVGSQMGNPYNFPTDDRGVYRIYGLPAGRYIVCVGEANDSGSIRIGVGGGFYARTFHPNATEQTRAAIIEVTPGTDTTGIDIVVSPASKSFTASGRVVDLDTGKPLPNIQFAHGALMKDNRVGGYGYSGQRTNANGEFRLEGLTPGRYAAFVIVDDESNLYSEPAPFEITNEDIKGVEIKVRRGATISGIAVVEGANDPDIIARLSSLQLLPLGIKDEGLASPHFTATRIAADGSFRIAGLRSGKVTLRLAGMPNDRKGFSVLRIERDGRDQREGIEVEAGEQVTGVRLVLAYGTSIIRGLVKIQGGELADDYAMSVYARRAGENTYTGFPVMVDARHRFAIEGLIAGEYELELQVISADYDGPPSPIAPVKHKVIVPPAGATEVTLTLNLAAREKDN
jgi:protocatechuate 3,4-dioxygenase beta subunit